VQAGNWPAEGAVERARAEMDRLLPERELTPGHALYTARDKATHERVGSIWLYYKVTEQGGDAFVYDLFIEESCRGKGYGEELLRAGEALMRQHGAKKIALHVFGFNTVAQSLYRKLGYQITNVNMAKLL
jgi:ribosomal protein S18 acetylase RimI-like enzyme